MISRLAGLALLLLVLAACGGADQQPRASAPATTSTPEATGDLASCAGMVGDEGRGCYSAELAKIVDDAKDPLAAVEGITAAAYADQSGFLLANCHGIMHTVAREYALRTHLTLAKLMDNLPATNDPGCSAGYAHGLVTAVAPEIEKAGPKVANQLCAEAETRYQRYSCTHGFGHAFMRLNSDQIQPSLQMCRQLGSGAAPDCSQGVYHDYWFSVNGIDATKRPENPVTEPRELCGAQPAEFVRPCWYRAFVETQQGRRVGAPEDFEDLCGGLEGLQRQACVTGASVIGPPDPRNQLTLCSGLSSATDVVACIRGTKVQNLLQYPDDMKVDLIKDCRQFKGSLAATCYRWLGKTLGVVSDGKLLDYGCPKLPKGAPRKACAAGVKSMDGPLVTFS
ncbi:MAG TPA: hypothetical protein VNS09_17590 [Solirubrobacter sp.]|nr:hypothetical protein [Solirubrobacter sp.]